MSVSAIEEKPAIEPRGKPFIRWVGGKSKLLPELLKLVPETFGTHHEPFLGSGALFFALQPPRAILSDANNRLTCTFGAIQRDLDLVLSSLRVYAEMYAKHGAPFYLHARGADLDAMESHELAALFIFLNKTGFNGLWRVNASGKYNVPAGEFKRPPTVCDEPCLRACSKALAGATIVNSDFRAVEERAVAGDLAYFDPPYIPVSKTSDFTNYTADGFKHSDQIALRDLALRLKRRGVHVLLSNSDTPVTRELYTGFELHATSRGGGMNSDTAKRGRVGELLIR